MLPPEYRFSIDVFTPDTLPMKRLAEYLLELAKLLGSEADVHFDRIEEGSVNAIASVEDHARARVDSRLRSATSDDAPSDVRSAFKAIDDRLAEDNAVGTITALGGGTVIRFPGRMRPKPIEYPAFTEPAFIEGVLTSLSGTDETKHAQLMDGDTKYTGLQTKDLELLSRLRNYLWGDPIRLIGRGRFQRLANGTWEMKSFLIDDFEQLERLSFKDTVARLRSIPDGVKVTGDLLRKLASDREED